MPSQGPPSVGEGRLERVFNRGVMLPEMCAGEALLGSGVWYGSGLGVSEGNLKAGRPTGSWCESPHWLPSVVMGWREHGGRLSRIWEMALVGSGREGEAEMTSRLQTCEVSMGKPSLCLCH